MEFRIDFNRFEHDDDTLLEQLGAKPKFEDFGNGEELIGYYLEVKSIEEMKKLQEKVQKIKGDIYFLVIDFEENNNTIFFDKDV